MWAHRVEFGESQLTFNYVRALSDWMTNFSFNRGVSFRSPKETEAIVPALLQRVWENDNDKAKILWEIGQVASVSGDAFVKISYEEPRVTGIDENGDAIPGVMQSYMPGKVRIIPLNPSYVFPVWHPHDRSRMIECKLRYRFWSTDLSGTRAVYSYTETINEAVIREYINDEMIDERPNILGLIEVIHIPNIAVSGSPWGLSDIQEVISLNREFNEKATEISEIISYHQAPITVITGAKSSSLEKGAKKVWSLPNANSQVFNLTMGEDLNASMAFLELLKRSMHELTGVPEGALGQTQPISNTSGVALSIQYQPAINKREQKKTQFTAGFQRINEIILRTLAIKEPEAFTYNPAYSSDPTQQAGEALQLDLDDPVTYQTTVHWPDPLPVDQLIKLNELMAKMNLGLESKTGALRELGYEFPDEKMAEIFDELMDDAKRQGALDMLHAQITQAVALATGIIPDSGGEPVVSAGGSNVTSAGSPSQTTGNQGGSSSAQGPALPPVSPAVSSLLSDLNIRAWGTRNLNIRNPANDPTDS